MHVDSVYLLRQAVGLDQPGTPVKVSEPFQMNEAIGADGFAAVASGAVRLIRELLASDSAPPV